MVDQKSTPKKSRRWWRICHYVILGKTRPCQKMNGLHDGIKTKLAQSQEFKAPSHPNSWPEKCSVQSTVWVIACCWLITLFKGGINLFLNWVWNNHYTDLHLIWWSWKSWLPTAGTLLFFYDHLEVFLISVAHQLLKKGSRTLLFLLYCLWSHDRSINGGGQICHAEMWCSCGSWEAPGWAFLERMGKGSWQLRPQACAVWEV